MNNRFKFRINFIFLEIKKLKVYIKMFNFIYIKWF